MSYSISQKFNAKSLLAITLPSIFMMAFVSVYSMFGSIFASRFIGENALSAINIVFPLFSTVIAIAVMFATGSNAIISTNLGVKDVQRARENFTMIVIVGGLTGVGLGIITYIFRYPIIHALGSTPTLDPLCIEYLTGYVFIFPFIFWQLYTQYFFVTEGKPLVALVTTIVGGLLNITLCYLTMGVWGMGIIGAIIGAGASFIIPSVVFLIFFARNKKGTLCFVKPKRHERFVLNTCANGSSEMVTNLAIAIVTAVLNVIMVNLAGEDGVAAVSVIVQVKFLLNSIYIGFGAGVAPIFGYARGADDREQIKKVLNLSLKFVIISSVVLVGISVGFADNIVSAFIRPDSSAYSLAKTGFMIFCFGYLFAGINIFSSVFFTSLSNGKVSAIISFVRTFALTLGLLIILPKIWGTTGAWLATPLSELGALIVAIIYLKLYKKVYHY
jgi:Na+-driven multidrug efflux pump